jgi:hypothetical protein
MSSKAVYTAEDDEREASGTDESEEREVVPFDVNDADEVDVSGEEDEGVLETHRRVPLLIKAASIRIGLEDNKRRQADDNKWLTKKLHLELKIDEEGVDGDGALAGRVVFQDYLYLFNNAEFPEKFLKNKKKTTADYYATRARSPFKGLLKAVGHDPKEKVVVNDDFLERILGVPIYADILKKPRQALDNVTDKWVNTDEFQNEVQNAKARVVGTVEKED